jgi:preprotein translocase, SecE subunit, bacterial
MAEVKKAETTNKKSWFKGLKSEFNKIIWTDRDTLIKQTIAVVAITALIAIMILVVDEVAMNIVDILTH